MDTSPKWDVLGYLTLLPHQEDPSLVHVCKFTLSDESRLWVSLAHFYYCMFWTPAKSATRYFSRNKVKLRDRAIAFETEFTFCKMPREHRCGVEGAPLFFLQPVSHDAAQPPMLHTPTRVQTPTYLDSRWRSTCNMQEDLSPG